MRNQFFEPGFLFDLYSDRRSTATLSAHSNVSWCGLSDFFHVWSPVTQILENLEKQFSAVW